MRRSVWCTSVVLSIVVAASPAAAEAPDSLGWWTRRPGAEPLGPAAFELAAGVQGEESVAAVRVDDDAVRLIATAGEGGSDDTAFRACRATTGWTPADGGAWDDRPSVDCTTAVDAVRAGPDRWSVDLAALRTGTALDVVLVPVVTEVVPGLGSPVGFRTTFIGLEVVLDAESAAPTPAAPTRPPTASPGAGIAPAATPAPVPTPAPYSAPLPTPAAPTSTAPAPTAPPTAASGGAIEAPMFELTADGDRKPWARLLLLVPLSAVVGVAAAAVRNEVQRRQPHVLT